MSRTIEQIYNDLILQKETFGTLTGLTNVSDYQTFLSNLTSDSKVSNWNLELYNQSVVIKTMEDKIETERNNINTLLSSSFVMTAEWYRLHALLFQYGDIVQLIDYVPAYASVDVEKQIIEFCSVEEVSGGILLKVRRKDSGIMTGLELNAFQSYLDDIKGIGTTIEVINLPPDSVSFYFSITYDPQINLDELKENVSNTLTNYVQNLPFDSKVYANDVIDLLQQLTGVIDPEFRFIKAKPASNPSYTNYGWVYNLVAGYGVLYNVENTITYNVG